VKEIFEKMFVLQKNNFNENILIDDENSLTYQLLNQQETEFEKTMFKSRKIL